MFELGSTTVISKVVEKSLLRWLPRVLTNAPTLTIMTYKIKPYFFVLQFCFPRFTSKAPATRSNIVI